ncbi:MAG TPA: hypothetical protein PKK59_03925 [Anaerolineaceae bacterium]|nr:hypothetical protein [Anaerolineaceae bacterium]
MRKRLKKIEQFNPFKDRTPVQRRNAAQYLMITLLSFAVSISGTRLFLELTGYPRLARGEIHIAHVLWGGLFLFISALLPLILANEWGLRLSALLAGLGIGFFIDEVGKFITQTNDYFHPAAAPIVYVFFLLTVLLFAFIRNRRKSSSRSEMYEILERFHEVLDHDLSTEEYRALIDRLDEVITDKESKPLAELAESLRYYLEVNRSRVVPDNPIFIERLRASLRRFEKNWLVRKRFRQVVIIALFAWGAWALVSPIGYLLISRNAPQLSAFVDQLISNRLVRNASGLNWFEARVLIEGGAGILAILSALMVLFKFEKQGVMLGIIVLLVTLTVVNPLVFYFEQFSTLIVAAMQFILLILLIRYRKRFLRLK